MGCRQDSHMHTAAACRLHVGTPFGAHEIRSGPCSAGASLFTRGSAHARSSLHHQRTGGKERRWWVLGGAATQVALHSVWATCPRAHLAPTPIPISPLTQTRTHEPMPLQDCSPQALLLTALEANGAAAAAALSHPSGGQQQGTLGAAAALVGQLTRQECLSVCVPLSCPVLCLQDPVRGSILPPEDYIGRIHPVVVL
jgi:hypothetical protein